LLCRGAGAVRGRCPAPGGHGAEADRKRLARGASKAAGAGRARVESGGRRVGAVVRGAGRKRLARGGHGSRSAGAHGCLGLFSQHACRMLSEGDKMEITGLSFDALGQKE
jgi:hypothetical protein